MTSVQLHPNAKLWNERDFNECCFPIGGVGRGTVVCGAPCDGAYCRAHRALMDESCGAISTRPQRRREVQARRIAPASPTANQILAEIMERHNVTMDDLTGFDRHFTEARNEAFARLHKAGKSLPWIGRLMGGRHHTSVLHGIRRYRERLAA